LNDEADAREEFSDIEISMDQRGDDVRIQVDGPRRRSYRSMQIRFTVKVPAAMSRFICRKTWRPRSMPKSVSGITTDGGMTTTAFIRISIWRWKTMTIDIEAGLQHRAISTAVATGFV
jgi:hypothetical protein